MIVDHTTTNESDYALGKGEVESSIPSSSTMISTGYAAFSGGACTTETQTSAGLTPESPCKIRAASSARKEADLYVMQAVTGLIKIGRSLSPAKRLRALQQAAGHKIRLLLVLPGRGAEEASVHATVAAYRTMGEWFHDTADSRRAITAALGGIEIKWIYGAGGSLAKARAVRIANIETRERAEVERCVAALAIKLRGEPSSLMPPNEGAENAK